MSTGKVVGGFFRVFRAVIWRPCFLGLLYGDLQEGLLGVDWAGGKARSNGAEFRRRPLEKRCWKWLGKLGKVEAFGVEIK